MKDLNRSQLICSIKHRTVSQIRGLVAPTPVRAAIVLLDDYYGLVELHPDEVHRHNAAECAIMVIFSDKHNTVRVGGLLSLYPFKVGEIYSIDFANNGVDNDICLISTEKKINLRTGHVAIEAVAGMKIAGINFHNDFEDVVTLRSVIREAKSDVSALRFKVVTHDKLGSPVFTIN